MEVQSVEAIIGALNSAGVQYLIVGGLAVIAHGYERLTRDVDLVIGLETENVIKGLRTLIGIGYNLAVPIQPEQFADPEMRETWRREKNMVVLKLWSDAHRRTPVDVFIYEPFDFAQEFAAARWEPVAGDMLAPIVRYETLLELKRAAARPQDIADIAELEQIQKLRDSNQP